MGDKDAGSVSVLGFDHLRDELAMKQRVGYVSPDLDFRAWGRVSSAIHFVRGFYPTWDELYCTQLLAALHVGRDERIGALSFGARTKLALVLALSWRPQLLILDEPTVGLDAISKQQVFAELLAAVRTDERTVLISSHTITDLERFADHVGMIKQGRLVFEGAITDVMDRYRMVDFTVERLIELANQPGIIVQATVQNRWRVLLDLQRSSLEWLRGRGASQIADTPVSLEDLFVALGRD
jgi:ABC-2 type transport system ATP-binding protein